MAATQEELDRFFAWRDEWRRKHRYMTYGEYMGWLRGGDAISSPTSATPFPCGLTIDINTPPIIGRVAD